MSRDWRTARWTDHPKNPLIDPPPGTWLIADPCVLAPDVTPDGKWHMFANAVNVLHQYVSDDGLEWRSFGGELFSGIRPFCYVQDGFHLFYERLTIPLGRSCISYRFSDDLVRWTDPIDVLQPSLPWEGRVIRTNGNPCLVDAGGYYRLYFSAAYVWLWDCLYWEPVYIGVAEADRITGPYYKWPSPLIGPSERYYWRSLGAGSIKVRPPKGGMPWLAFNNGIFKDEAGRSRSEIHLLESTDGLVWDPVGDEPILAPEPGWKEAFVYAMDIVEYGGDVRLYYNARDGWLRGKERIGLAQPRWDRSGSVETQP
ncbi:MAG: glycosyl hydrolase family 43 [Deltaproteobacteria bacterium]|nr:glycosyl hydrolase family 43 [Deltaproteobacteria bacterium]MCB9478712.1 glycosyl hydrolase family 43 [Deltaproteobacteria bacterium]MCB9488228.1 glycosyl hydrolase family 43 [Deltaproteobacteria bacterium]